MILTEKSTHLVFPVFYFENPIFNHGNSLVEDWDAFACFYGIMNNIAINMFEVYNTNENVEDSDILCCGKDFSYLEGFTVNYKRILNNFITVTILKKYRTAYYLNDVDVLLSEEIESPRFNCEREKIIFDLTPFAKPVSYEELKLLFLMFNKFVSDGKQIINIDDDKQKLLLSLQEKGYIKVCANNNYLLKFVIPHNKSSLMKSGFKNMPTKIKKEDSLDNTSFVETENFVPVKPSNKVKVVKLFMPGEKDGCVFTVDKNLYEYIDAYIEQTKYLSDRNKRYTALITHLRRKNDTLNERIKSLERKIEDLSKIHDGDDDPIVNNLQRYFEIENLVHSAKVDLMGLRSELAAMKTDKTDK